MKKVRFLTKIALAASISLTLAFTFCSWNGVYSDSLHKTIYYYTSGVSTNITLEEFSNIKDFNYRAQSRK